ncbi:hypothetical protein J5Y04_08035 [Kitasatospora sp. RG8]|uniref:hypothetical protein n=1 Tax=Kitasatospora sp. RG8 TaxID=2820815 RepID=UPI001ADF93C1|nr:hypothetical protein [Kitasatospora sp. RG8]MBP0449501.1 hypothetical protein [Kitasatospora sp. RG8]
MAEYRLLCERAVDPLEIAVGLEEAGLGQEAAARCRHADLFGLAEELYARVPRRPPAWSAAGEADAGAAGSRQRRCGAALRTSVLTALPVAAAAALGGRWPVLLPAAVPLALLPALPTASAEPVPSGPCATAGPELGPSAALPEASHPAGPRRWRPAALGYGAGVAGLLLLPLAGAVGGPGDGRVTVALVLAAALSAGSAEWAAHWFRHVGGGHLRTAGTLAEFRARMGPVLPVAVALHLAVLTVLSFAALAVLTALAPRPGPGHDGGLLHLAAERAGPAQWAAQGVLGLLLVLTALLARCGRHRGAALGALAGSAAAAVPLVLGRSAPVAGLLGGGAVALALLVYAWPALGRADAHR